MPKRRHVCRTYLWDSKLNVVPSQILKQQSLNPRNVGSIDSPEGLGEASSLACGALVRITLRINSDKNIADARFKAIGCRLLVMSASVLTEEIKGRSTAEAAQLARSRNIHADTTSSIRGSRLAPRPGETPELPAQCTAMCRDALLSAITHYSDAMREEWIGEEALICTCFGVSESAIEREVRSGSLRLVEEVTDACKAGAGCRSCYPLIQEILDVHWREKDLGS